MVKPSEEMSQVNLLRGESCNSRIEIVKKGTTSLQKHAISMPGGRVGKILYISSELMVKRDSIKGHASLQIVLRDRSDYSNTGVRTHVSPRLLYGPSLLS